MHNEEILNSKKKKLKMYGLKTCHTIKARKKKATGNVDISCITTTVVTFP